MTAPDGGPTDGMEDVGLIMPVPEPGLVMLVIRDGDKYAYMPVPRALLEDPEAIYDGVRMVLTQMDRYIAQLEQHRKARNASGKPSTGT